MRDFLPPVIFENGLYYELKGEQYYPCLLPPEPDGEEEQLALIVQQMAKAQEDVENTDFTASVGGGAVQAVVSGKKELKALTIQPEAVDPQDVEMLQDLVISAVNEALRQADEAMSNSMNSLTGGLNIPGLL